MAIKTALKLAASLAFFSSPVCAGAVTTGGGVLYEQQANPWFLQNTPHVSYCIEIDREHVHLDPAVIHGRVRHALTVWNSQLTTATIRNIWEGPPAGERLDVELGTQEFTEETCQESTQLRFQFGILSPAQLAAVGDPRQDVATTVRTAYDTVQLRGKGFIYVAPDSGPLRPTSLEFALEPWSVCNGCLLERAVLHELGHVFGLAHSGEDRDLMGQRHLETITRARFIDRNLDLPWLTAKSLSDYYANADLFTFPTHDTFEDCSGIWVSDEFFRAFHIDHQWKCIKVALFRIGPKALEIYAAKDKHAPYQLIGDAEKSPSKLTFSSGTISVRLDADQAVFPAEIFARKKTLRGPSPILREEKSLTYVDATSKQTQPLLLELAPNRRWRLLAVVDGLLNDIAFETEPDL